MYSHINRNGLSYLGEAPDAVNVAPGGFPDWLPEVDSNVDADLIAIAYYSPDSGFGPQRIMDYDWPLEEHVSINGISTPLELVDFAKLVPYDVVDAPELIRLPAYQRGFLGEAQRPWARLAHSMPAFSRMTQPHHPSPITRAESRSVAPVHPRGLLARVVEQVPSQAMTPLQAAKIRSFMVSRKEVVRR